VNVLRSLPLLLVSWGTAVLAQGAMETREIATGFLPGEWVTGKLRKVLSPGAPVTLIHGGQVRVTDQIEKVQAAVEALLELQKAPAVVPMEIVFTTVARKTVQRVPLEQPVAAEEFPFPHRFDPPRIIMNGNGGFTVIPIQPRDFRSRSVGAGTAVNPSGMGYFTREPEVRMAETTTTAVSTPRRFSVSTVPGRAVSVTLLNPVPDAAGLRALAEKLQGVDANEPAWTVAATELVVTPEISGAALLLTIVPQVALPPPVPGEAPRRVPLRACAASVLVTPEARTNVGLLPRTDPEFYRLFLGTPEATEETYTSVGIRAAAQYLGSPPQ